MRKGEFRRFSPRLRVDAEAHGNAEEMTARKRGAVRLKMLLETQFMVMYITENEEAIAR
jgi:hypothetical protein